MPWSEWDAPQRPLRLRCLFFAQPLHAERSAAFRDLCSKAAIPLSASFARSAQLPKSDF
jgi:hypothetical protein